MGSLEASFCSPFDLYSGINPLHKPHWYC